MQQPGRTYSSSSSYRFGFNGKEKSDEIIGGGVDYDYGARIYDSRTARFLSLDPLQKNYPELTPYQFASNSSIAYLDRDGKESYYYTISWNQKTGKPAINLDRIEQSWLDRFVPNHLVVNFNNKGYQYYGDFLNSEMNDGTLSQILRNIALNPVEAQKKIDENNERAINDREKSAEETKQIFAQGFLVGMLSTQIVSSPEEEVSQQSSSANSGKPVTSESMDAVSTKGQSDAISKTAGMNNSKVKAAVELGNKVHYDGLNGGPAGSISLPSELQARYPETEFQFARRGQAGPDVTVVGGLNPWEYPNSTWAPGNKFGDFKPNTNSGNNTFKRDVKSGKLPANTQKINYNSKTGALE